MDSAERAVRYLIGQARRRHLPLTTAAELHRDQIAAAVRKHIGASVLISALDKVDQRKDRPLAGSSGAHTATDRPS